MGGGDMRREKREMIRNKSWEAHKCSLVSVVDPVTEAEGGSCLQASK